MGRKKKNRRNLQQEVFRTPCPRNQAKKWVSQGSPLLSLWGSPPLFCPWPPGSLWLGLVGRQQGALGSHPMARAPAPGSSAKDELSQRSHTASQRCHPAPIPRRTRIRVEVMLGDAGHDTRGLGHTPTHNLGLCANYNPQTFLHK